MKATEFKAMLAIQGYAPLIQCYIIQSGEEMQVRIMSPVVDGKG